MIVSIAIAVLPVCRSPIISWRWPRPIGVIASIALMPVCSGSFTGWRCTTLGAWSSRARRSELSTGPLPSSGSPSGPTTRPRKPSPTGTESTSPVRLTRWPSSIRLKSPRMTTPISRMSRFSARPRVPSSNSSSSFAIAEGKSLDPGDAVTALGDGADLLGGSGARLVGLDETRQGVPDLLRPDSQLRHLPRVFLVCLVLSQRVAVRSLPVPRRPGRGAARPAGSRRCR